MGSERGLDLSNRCSLSLSLAHLRFSLLIRPKSYRIAIAGRTVEYVVVIVPAPAPAPPEEEEDTIGSRRGQRVLTKSAVELGTALEMWHDSCII